MPPAVMRYGASRAFGFIATAALIATAAAGCTSAAASSSTASTEAAGGRTATAPVAVTPVSVASTLPVPTSGARVTLRFDETSQAEVLLSSGRRIYIDVGYPINNSATPRDGDILLISQGLPHHYDRDFEASFSGQKLVSKAGEIKLDDVTIRSIEAAQDNQPIEAGNANNHIFVIESAGLRMVHCGELDQDKLTDAQLAAIGGRVDVAICPIKNPGAEQDPTGRTSLDLIDQLNPRVVIPTDTSMETAELAAAEWKATFSTKPSITVLPGQLPGDTTLIFLGKQAETYGRILGLSETTNW